MISRNEENLKDLFEKFFDSEQAEQAVEDIHKAEQILREYPSPEPDDQLIANIKTDIAATLQHKKTGFPIKAVYKAAAVAAVLVLAAIIGVNLFQKDHSEPERLAKASIIPTAIWESYDIAADDADLATLTAEIEQVEGDVLSTQLGENSSNGLGESTELETELIEINSDFWKG